MKTKHLLLLLLLASLVPWVANAQTNSCVTESFPWTENFNSYSNGYFNPQCWSYKDLNNHGHSFQIENGRLYLPHGNPNGLMNGAYCRLTLPQLELPSDHYAFSLDVYREAETYGEVEVFVSTNGSEFTTPIGYISTRYNYNCTNYADYHYGTVPPENGAGWYTYSFNIPNSGSCYIVLRCTSDWAGQSYTPKNLYMDNFCIREVPYNLAVSNITASTADISWTPATVETEWRVQYGTHNAFYNGTFQEVTVTGNPSVTLTNLDPVQRYHVRVKAVYGSEKSGWSLPLSFDMASKYTIGRLSAFYKDVPITTDYKYSYTQQIFTHNELGDAGTIRSIEFFRVEESPCNRNVDVYLTYTDKETFESNEDWVSVNTNQRVFSGTLNFSGNDWTVVELNTPFNYDGQHNLAIIVDDNTGVMQSQTYFYAFTTDANHTHVCHRSENINPQSPGTGYVRNGKNIIRLVKDTPKYHIANTASDTQMTWAEFVNMVNLGCSYEGETVYLDEDITSGVSMVGSSDDVTKSFQGTFDGQGHTIAIDWTVTGQRRALFGSAKNATFKNLRVTGTINTSNKYTAGFVGRDWEGHCTFINCESNVTINSSFNGDANNGGFVGMGTQGTFTFEGCAFTGVFEGFNTSQWGGFVGQGGNANSYNNCVFAPNQISVNTDGSFTFDRPRPGTGNNFTFTNTYYSESLGTAQGKQMYHISGVNSVIAEIGGDNPTYYYVSGITACSDSQGLQYYGVKASGGDVVKLKLMGGYTYGLALINGATLTGNRNPYILTMVDDNVGISADSFYPLPFTTDFESGCELDISNGNKPNRWCWGTAASNGGTHGLYISNDGGATNTYGYVVENETVYAFRPLHFERGVYEISYDWRSNGQFLRVALADQTNSLDPQLSSVIYNNSLPDTWIALDGGSALYNSTEWQTVHQTIEFDAAVDYQLVFAWVNYSFGDVNNPPAAIDNVSVVSASCDKPFDLECTGFTGTTATFSWVENGNATAWQICLNDDEDNLVDADSNPFTVTGITPEIQYTAKVRANCGDEQSFWSNTVSFSPSSKVVIGSGSDILQALPLHGDAHYSLTQQIYTADELGDADDIVSIDFFRQLYSYYPGPCVRNIDIYMTHTDKNDFTSNTDWVGVTAANLVFSGIVEFTSDMWTTITLDSPFEYDGQHNVIITVDDNTGNGEIYVNFLAFVIPGYPYQSLMINDYSDDSGINYDPTTNPGEGSRHFMKNQLRVLKRPHGPENLQCTDVSPTTAELSWNGNSESYVVMVSQDKASWDEIPVATSTTYTLTGLLPDTIYYVKVKGINGIGETAPSHMLRFSTLDDCPVPTNLHASYLTPTSADLTWNASPYVDSYTLWYKGRSYTDGFEEHDWSYFVYSFPPSPNSGNIDTGWFTGYGALSDVMNGSEIEPAEYWRFGDVNSVFDGHAYYYYGNDGYCWLISPKREVPQGGALNFDLALTAAYDPYSSTYDESVLLPPTHYSDANKFMVLASTDDGATWDILRQWDDVGSPYVFGNINCTASGENVNIDLSNYVGQQIYIAFYTECVEHDFNNLHIDNVRIGFIHPESEWQSLTAPGNLGQVTATIEDLTTNRVYDAYVIGDCDGASLSETTFFSTPTTEPDTIVTVPYVTDFTTASEWSYYQFWSVNGWHHVSNPETNCIGIEDYYTNRSGSAYAYLSIQFEPGYHIISYDWKGMGESGRDYLRVALVPIMTSFVSDDVVIDGFSSYSLPEGWIALDGGSQLVNSAEWQHQVTEVMIPYEGKYKMVFVWTNDENNYGVNPGASFDNVSIVATNCLKPTDLEANAITFTTAVLSWTENGNSTAWQVCLNGDMDNLIDVTENPYTLTGLASGTTYTAKVRAVTDDEQGLWSDEVTFIIPTSVYSTDFETICDWTLVNGSCTNAWTWGEAAHNGTGTHGLYISNDGGATNAYDNTSNTMVYAYKTFNFAASHYNFAYDWKADGENRYDFLRVALVPASVSLEAGTSMPTGFNYNTLPEGWIALDGGSQLSKAPDWQTVSQEIEIATAGYYNVVFVWRNDNTTGTNPPAVIDNMSIEAVSCFMPIELHCTTIASTTATLAWMGSGEATAWQVCLNDDETHLIDLTENPGILTNLTSLTTYTAKVRSNCGDEQSVWSNPITFTTIMTPAGLPYSTDFETECDWTLVNGSCINAWTWGTAAHNGEGTYGLYVSNDGGAHNTYNLNSSTMVYATKPFDFEAGVYSFSYDWKANGENVYDFLRVALVPANVSLEAGSSWPTGFNYNSLPESWIALDGGSRLQLAAEWQTITQDVDVPVAGVYMMVFVWRNDGSTGINPPAAIDNVSIEAITCQTPANLTVSYIGATKAVINWTGRIEVDSYTVKYRPSVVLAEDFENSIGDWTLRDCHVRTGIDASAAHSGQYGFCFYYNTTPPQYLISPELSGVGEGMRLEFYYRNADTRWPETFQVGFSATDNETASFTFGDEITASDTQWHLYSEPIPAGTKYICWKLNSYDKLYLYIDDIEVGQEGNAVDWQTATVAGNANEVNATLTGLMPETNYVAYVYPDCNPDKVSETVSFMTNESQLSYYATDFETTCDWTLVNGSCTNAWTWGEAAHNGTGTHGLYISNDGGSTNVYDGTSGTMVYAYKTFNFAASRYNFTYDWKANGENQYDFLRVALVPASVSLEAGTSRPTGFSYNTLPEGWIAFDGGSQLNLASGWNTMSQEIEIATAGHYNVVFAWRNDYNYGSNPPAAIDNVSIEAITCLTPANLSVSDIGATNAVVNWTGEIEVDSYTVKYRPSGIVLTEGFENGIGDWTLRNCYSLTGINSGAAHSGSAAFRFYYNTNPPQYLISPKLTDVAEGMKLEFYYKNAEIRWTETFQVGFSATDNATESFTFGDEITASDEQWHLYSELIPAGTKYICWKLNSHDKCYLYIDDIVVGLEDNAVEWQTITVAGNANEVNTILTGLMPETEYEVYVYPDCDPDKVSDMLSFMTLEQPMLTQTLSLSAGVNWVSFYVETTLNDLKTALVSASNNASGIKITSQSNGYTSWNGSSWKGSLSPFDVRQMYVIEVPAACDFTLEAMPINPAAYPITIVNGINWIGFPFSADMTLTNAFSGFAVNGDKVMSLNNGSATYQGSWSGGLSSLQPGQGYKFESTTTVPRTFTFPTGAKKAKPFNPMGK